MSSQRMSGRRRLRFEVLEAREVPAILTGTDAEAVPPGEEPKAPDEVVVTTVDGDPNAPPLDDIPVDLPKPIDEELPAPTDEDLAAQNEVVDETVVLTATGDPELPSVDLATTATVDKPKPSIGDVVTITVKVENNGMDAATGVAIDTALPSGMTFVSAAPGTGGTFDEETGVWKPASVLPDVPQVLQIKAKVTDAVAGAVTATIAESDHPDPQEGNNEASLTVSPVLAGLKLTKTSSASAPFVGTAVIVNVTVRNTGPGTARNVVVTDTLGDGLRLVRVLPVTRGTFSAETKTWTIPALKSGAVVTLQMLVVVTKAERIESPATMTATGIDPARSQLETTGVVTGVKVNQQTSWSYFAGLNFQPGPGPVPAPARPIPTLPTRPTMPIIPVGSALAQIWHRFGLPRV